MSLAGGLDPQGAVEVCLRGKRAKPGRGAGRVHDGFGHRLIGASFPECLAGGVCVEAAAFITLFRFRRPSAEAAVEAALPGGRC